MPARLDVKPEWAVSVFPLILEVAFLAVQARPVSRMGESRRPLRALVARSAGHRTRDDLKGLKVAMAVSAFEGPMGAHQGKTRFIMVEARDVPGRLSMAGITIATGGALVIIGVAGRAGPRGLIEFQVAVTGPAAVGRMKDPEVLGFMAELHPSELDSGRVAILALFLKAGAVGRLMAAPAGRLRTFLAAVAGLAGQLQMAALEEKSRGFVLLGLGLRNLGLNSPGLILGRDILAQTLVKEAQGQTAGRERSRQEIFGVSIHWMTSSPPQSFQTWPWHWVHFGSWLGPP